MTKWMGAALAAVTFTSSAWAETTEPTPTPSPSASVDLPPVGTALPAPTPLLVAAKADKKEAVTETAAAAAPGDWTSKFYGFLEFDSISDGTQSFSDSAGNNPIAPNGGFAGSHGRLIYGVRNSRLGWKLTPPEYHGVKALFNAEMDFLGNQPGSSPNSTPAITEGAFFTNPTFRIRHFYVKADTAAITFLAGQYWQLFGWQPYFQPNTVEIQGIPGEVYSRSPQVRVSKVFHTGKLDIEAALAASRPPQKDSGTPDGQGGVRITIPTWKGVHTVGAAGTAGDSFAVGLSGDFRHFDVIVPTGTDESTNGWGFSADVLVPIIGRSLENRAGALTFTGSWATGTGTSDLYTGLTGGIKGPVIAAGPPAVLSDVDAGLIAFDANGNPNTIDWQSAIAGLQYYLPGSSNVFVSANYSEMHSGNIGTLAGAANAGTVFGYSRWMDGNVFWDATQQLRFGLEYAYFEQQYASGSYAHNDRVQFSTFFIF